MRKQRVAVVGAGMTLFRRRLKESSRELAYEAAGMALESAGLSLSDIDAVVLGSAPDAFDGFHMKGEAVLDGAGGVGKPYVRSYAGGATGVMAPVTGWWHVASGLFDLCLVVSVEKMSAHRPHPQAAFWTIFDPLMEKPLGVNLIWIFALEMSRYMSAYGIRKEQIAPVSVKNKANALDHPCAQLPARISVEDVLKSEVLVWPVQRLDVSPTSDGAAAVVLASERTAKRLTDTPVWIDGVGWNIDSAYWANRDLAFPEYLHHAARMAYRMAKVKDPRKAFDVAEVYDPFAYKELHHLEGLGLCGRGEAPRLLEAGVTERGGELPVNPSGGLLGVGNPIAAAGTMKVCEVFWQLRGEAGRRQVKGKAETGLAQAWGGLMQFASVMVLRR